MAIYEDYYVINTNSHIKSVPTFLCNEFLKELQNDDGTLKPHVSELDTSVTHYGKPCIKCTIPTLFIEIEYKTSDGHYLISHEVFLYEEDYPNLKELEDYKINLILILVLKLNPKYMKLWTHSTLHRVVCA